MEEQEGALLEETERLERQIKVLQFEKRRYVPLIRPSIRLDGQQGVSFHKRSVEVSSIASRYAGEKEARIVSTEDLTLCAATYLGITSKTVRDVLAMRNTKDRRGQYIRVRDADIFKPYLRDLAEQWNLKGAPVTIKKLCKGLRDSSCWCRRHHVRCSSLWRRHE